MSEHTPGDPTHPTGDEDDAGAVLRRIQEYLERLRQRGDSDPTADAEWDRFARPCARIFRALVCGHHWSAADREDGVQDLWLMLVTRLPDLRFDPGRGDPRDWIAAAAGRRLVDRERYRRNHPVRPLGSGAAERLAGREPDPAAVFERNRLRELVRNALAELSRLVPPRDYEAFVLHWLQELSVREIALRLGMTEGQVWSSHHRTSRKLRPLLARRLDPESAAEPSSSPGRSHGSKGQGDCGGWDPPVDRRVPVAPARWVEAPVPPATRAPVPVTPAVGADGQNPPPARGGRDSGRTRPDPYPASNRPRPEQRRAGGRPAAASPGRKGPDRVTGRPIGRILVTGGCGFIGAHFVRHLLNTDPAIAVTNLDALTYAGNPDNLAELADDPRYHFVRGDIADRPLVAELAARGDFDAIVNLAAESHVDRSIDDATPFLRTNVLGTQCLLDAAGAAKVPRYVQVSTDEVYGTLRPDDPPFCETTPLAPNSPYAASKAGADLLVRAAHHTFGLDTVITRCSNNYGPYQFPEKLIPLFITNALADLPVPVYGDGRQVRDWIHVLDHCRGIDMALRRGRPGEVYNFGGWNERSNLDVARAILKLCGKPARLIRHVTDRPGHDRRYAVDCAKAEAELGWRPTVAFEEGLAETVAWYQAHPGWVDRVRSGDCRDGARSRD